MNISHSPFAKECACAVDAARSAGALIREYYSGSYIVKYKIHGHKSPVTIADHEANRAIHEILQGSFPQYGWLSEETVDSPARLSCHRVWVVDPLDGTKEFIDKIPEFAVSIALAEAGTPVLGVAYNPIQDQLFWAVRTQGAWCGTSRLRVSDTNRLADAVVLSSRSETKRGEWEKFTALFRTRPLGSAAYKLALIANGEADATFTLVPKNEWDVCAGTLLLEEAGGMVSTLTGQPLIFNQAKTLLAGLVASNTFLHPELLQLIEQYR